MFALYRQAALHSTRFERCVRVPRASTLRARPVALAYRRSLATASGASDPFYMETPQENDSVFAPQDTFLRRHIGPRPEQIQHILKTLGYSSVEEFVAKTVPEEVLLPEGAVDEKSMPALSESELARRSEELARQNKVFRSYIGMGYQNTTVPPVIMRNILENPGWYTSYTPYQPEISQGRLESLLNYQTMVKSLTGLDISNASLLDEGTAAAEAMILALGTVKDKKRNVFLVDDKVLPQTLAVLRGRAKGFGIEIVQQPLQENGQARELSSDLKERILGVLVQYPDVDGLLVDWAPLAKQVKEVGGLVVAATDLLALTMVKPPAEWGADMAVGNAARFGVPPGYGGPHAGFFAVTDALKRRMPGRLIGVSRDADGRVAYRLSLQTREQHIRREKATSNICTAQALLANMNAMYAVYHGPKGLRRIAAKVHALTRVLKRELEHLGAKVVNPNGAFFDTLTIQAPADRVLEAARAKEINLRRVSDDQVGVTIDETVTVKDLADIVSSFAEALSKPAVSVERLHEVASELGLSAQSLDSLQVGDAFHRTTEYLTQPVFNAHHSETALLRYIHDLQSKDLSLVHAMIPLGSCTMKLNSVSSMKMLSFPEYHALHPFAPVEQAQGYQTLIRELEDDLAKLTGFAAVSLQPNSGAQGEFAGLSVIRAYQEAQGQQQRNVCLIPTSAHGTNPASAVMAGMKVVPVQTLPDGTIDLVDLRAKAEKHKDVLAATMITEPGTTGIYFAKIKEAINIVHEFGGQVYLDGANLQAQVGVTNPVVMGADVTHLNLHKTFSIPHGGGGPGVGPIGVQAHLAQYLPGHPLVPTGGTSAIEPVTAAPWGSASILTIAWAYIKMLGWSGIRTSTITALLNANYVKERIQHKYKVKYVGKHGNVAHELLVDMAEFQAHGIQVMDVAKRLIDYGFHPPTCSWPISTGILIEITESEPFEEIERLCEALLSIADEVQEIKEGKLPKDNNMLKRAPHTVEALTAETWDRPYSRERAVYPVPSLRQKKFWPPVARVDDAYGDRNLVCECGTVDDYAA